MKKVYLIHGWGGSSSGGWFDWLKKEFKNRKIKVYAFDMPDTDKPKIDKWVGFLKKNIRKMDKETYFVGHSIGCQAILRFLEKFKENIKIAGCVFIAPWLILKNLEKEEEKIAMPWLETPINFNKIKKHTKNFLIIFSNNDPYVPLDNIKLFKEKINAKILIKKNEGHFDGSEKIKEVLNFILKDN